MANHPWNTRSCFGKAHKEFARSLRSADYICLSQSGAKITTRMPSIFILLDRRGRGFMGEMAYIRVCWSHIATREFTRFAGGSLYLKDKHIQFVVKPGGAEGPNQVNHTCDTAHGTPWGIGTTPLVQALIIKRKSTYQMSIPRIHMADAAGTWSSVQGKMRSTSCLSENSSSFLRDNVLHCCCFFQLNKNLMTKVLPGRNTLNPFEFP